MFGRQAGFHRTGLAQVLGQRARIDPLDPGHTIAPEVSVKRLLGTPVARQFGQFLDDKSPHLRTVRFFVENVHAVVADVRVGHGYDLPEVGRIGEHLLVAA